MQPYASGARADGKPRIAAPGHAPPEADLVERTPAYSVIDEQS
jgi:hypothetical protein